MVPSFCLTTVFQLFHKFPCLVSKLNVLFSDKHSLNLNSAGVKLLSVSFKQMPHIANCLNNVEKFYGVDWFILLFFSFNWDTSEMSYPDNNQLQKFFRKKWGKKIVCMQ